MPLAKGRFKSRAKYFEFYSGEGKELRNKIKPKFRWKNVDGLKNFKLEHGHLKTPMSGEHRKLYRFVKQMRYRANLSLSKSRRLSPNRIQEIQDIGVNFARQIPIPIHTHEQAWEDMWKELQNYHREFWDLLPHFGNKAFTDDSKKVRRWIDTQTSRAKKSIMVKK